MTCKSCDLENILNDSGLCLFFKRLQAKHSVKDAGVKLSLNPGQNEIILIFKIDDPENRAGRGKRADCLILYRDCKRQKLSICLVDLKNGNPEKAAEQVNETLSWLKSEGLIKNPNIVKKACYSIRGSHSKKSKEIKRFKSPDQVMQFLRKE